jgi:hypothetical protein
MRTREGGTDVIEAIRDQWLIVVGVLVVITALAWLAARR